MPSYSNQEIESRGPTVDAAIAAGLLRLGLNRDQVTVIVIDEGGADGLRQGDVSVLVKAARVDPGRVGGWRRGVDGHGVGGAGADGEVGVSQGVAGHVG